ncbi:MAG: hypothetical protein ABI634_13755 [Acidobacteriota bacterium]
MRAKIAVCVGVCATVSMVGLSETAAARTEAATLRTLYLAATTADGAFVTDLAASEIVVKADRRAGEVKELIRSTDQIHVAVLVDDGGSGLFQGPVAQLVGGLYGQAAFSISMLNPQPYRLNEFSARVEVLRPAVDKLVQRGRIQGDSLQVIEAVSWAAGDLRKRKLPRPVIVALVTSGEPGKTDIADAILEDLRASGASLHVAYTGGVPMGRVLMEGPAHSGGSSTIANNTRAFADAMTAIGKMLTNQYRLTYVLPDGVQPDRALEVATTRPGVRILAPTRVPTT